jgi:hypothetical protein
LRTFPSEEVRAPASATPSPSWRPPSSSGPSAGGSRCKFLLATKRNHSLGSPCFPRTTRSCSKFGTGRRCRRRSLAPRPPAGAARFRTPSRRGCWPSKAHACTNPSPGVRTLAPRCAGYAARVRFRLIPYSGEQLQPRRISFRLPRWISFRAAKVPATGLGNFCQPVLTNRPVWRHKPR